MRIVALSDQHGFLPDVPPCDLLIVAGDVCPDIIGPSRASQDPEQQQAWFDRHVRPWLAAAPATHKILTWGNHDWCGQLCTFDSDSPPHARTTDLQILVDDGTTVPNDEAGDMTIWATPWSNQFMQWAFMKEPHELERVYSEIPPGVDILVSHQPPYGCGDIAFDVETKRSEHVGSRELLAAIERARPGVVVCGHVHAGFGRYEHAGIAALGIIDTIVRSVSGVPGSIPRSALVTIRIQSIALRTRNEAGRDRPAALFKFGGSMPARPLKGPAVAAPGRGCFFTTEDDPVPPVLQS